MTAGLLALVGNVVALVDPEAVYGAETTTLADAALAQDVATALVAIPLLLFARAPVRLGTLLFLAYNEAIYCFSISFGPLFLLWTAVLGLSVYALLAGLLAAWQAPHPATVHRFGGWVLMAVAVVFTLAWLGEIVPDLVAGRASTSAATWEVPTNPVHVLDLAVFLPAAFLAGAGLLQGRRVGHLGGVPMLVFLLLTSVPIFLTPIVASVREHDVDWSAVGPVGLIAVLCAVALGRLLRVREPS